MARDGINVKALDEKPRIDAWSWVWQAWSEMSGDRITAIGSNATPWLSVDAYARRYGIEDEDFEIFAHGIRVLDITSMDYQKEVDKKRSDRKRKKEKQEAKKPKGKRRR